MNAPFPLVFLFILGESENSDSLNSSHLSLKDVTCVEDVKTSWEHHNSVHS